MAQAEETIKKKPLAKPTITKSQLQQLENNAEQAKRILEEPEFKFFRDYLVTEKEKIITDTVNNKRKEIHIFSGQEGGNTYETIHTRIEQEIEASGRFKFIFELLNYLTYTVNLPLEQHKAINKGSLILVDG